VDNPLVKCGWSVAQHEQVLHDRGVMDELLRLSKTAYNVGRMDSFENCRQMDGTGVNASRGEGELFKFCEGTEGQLEVN
jgi:hypothetical protein